MTFVPFDDRDGWIWMNGEFVPWRDAKIHVLSHALHYGSCVFEGERSYNGTIFEGKRHTERLLKSANILGVKPSVNAEQLEEAKYAALAKNGLENAYVRAFMWRGSEMMGVSAQLNTIHTAIAVWDWGNYYSDKMTGIRMGRAKWRRPDPATAPYDAKAAGLYMICTLSKHAAEDEGYADALMLDYRGQVAEATSANIFFVQDGAIHTPTPDCFLNGITRQTVIKIAREKGYEVIERKIMPEELGNFTECFTTGSAAEVTPVREIAGIMYKPSNVCEDMVTSYENLVRGK